MKFIKNKFFRFNHLVIFLSIILLWLTIFNIGCISSQTSSTSRPAVVSTGGSFENINPIVPQPMKSALSQGLLPRYHYNYQPTNLDPTGQGAFIGRKGTEGKPIPNINQKPGANKIFGSTASKLIGVELKGIMHFPSPGKYIFRVMVNDAARIFVGQEMIINDPQYGSDRYAGPSDVNISKSGFYEFKAQYYQRKGTSAFQLFWKTPGNTDFEIVPPGVFFHIP